MLVNVAVCGAGAFGRNHIRVYRELEQSGEVALAAIVESDPARAAALYEEFRVPVYASVEAALAARSRNQVHIDAASLCVPTSAHFAVAAPLLSAGIDLLIESPSPPPPRRPTTLSPSPASTIESCKPATLSDSTLPFLPCARCSIGPCSSRRTASASSRPEPST